MKHIFIFALAQLLVFAAPFSLALAEEPAPTARDSTHATWEHGVTDGDLSARMHARSGKWFGYGVGSGLLLGLLGTGIIVGVSQAGRPKPPPEEILHIADSTPQYQTGFADAYSKRAKKKNLGPALLGGLVGTALGVAIVMSFQD